MSESHQPAPRYSQADRIIVLEEGRVVQSGTYAELMGQVGLFRTLARRQMA